MQFDSSSRLQHALSDARAAMCVVLIFPLHRALHCATRGHSQFRSCFPHSTRRRGGIAYPSYTRRCRRIGFPHLNRNRFAVVFVASYMLHSYHTRTTLAIDESTVYILTCTRCMPDTFNYEYIEFFIFVFRISILHI